MQKTKRRILYAAMAVVLVVLQLSNALLALADDKTALNVSDVGDKELYALLAAATDESGNNRGILYKEDAERLTYLDLSSSNLYETVEKIQSFKNLSQICPNITSIKEDNMRYEDVKNDVILSEARDSFFDEIAKLDKLDSIEVYVDTQNQLTTLLNKQGKDNLTYLNMYFNGDVDALDISDLALFDNISKLGIERSLYIKDIKGLDLISKMKKLNGLILGGNYATEFQNIIDTLPSTVRNIELRNFERYSSGNNKIELPENVSLDVSKLSNVHTITLYQFDSVTGLDGLNDSAHGSDYYIDIIGNAHKTKVNFSSITDKVRYLYLYGCTLEDGTVIHKFPSQASNVALSNCGVTDIEADIPSSLKSLNLGYNNLASLPDLSNASLNSLEIDHNNIKDISSLAGMKELKYLNASFNDIESIPDFSGIDSLAGKSQRHSEDDDAYNMFNYDYYKLSLSGNKLTKAAIAGKVPSECENDIYWMYSATSRRYSKYELYYPEIDDTLVSKYIQTGMNTIATSQKEFTFDEDLVKYLKALKNKNQDYRLYIDYIEENRKVQRVSINPVQLSDSTTSFSISFDSYTETSDKDLENIFSKYGEIEKCIVKNDKKESNIDGVTYDSYSNYDTMGFDIPNENYHEYVYDPESKTFAYTGKTYNSNKNNRFNINSNSKKLIYFYVPDSKDAFINTYRYDKDGSAYYYSCYTELNDDVLNGLLLNNDLSLGNKSKYIEGSANINISKEMVSQLADRKYKAYLNVYDDIEKKNIIGVTLDYSKLKEQDIKTTLPTMTKKDGSMLEIPFAGGQADYLYEIDNTSDNCGIDYSFKVNSINRKENELGNNIYKVVGQSYIPLQLGNWGYSMSVPEGVKEQVFVIAAAKDEYMKTAVVEDGEYKGKQYTYLNKADSIEVKKLLSAYAEVKKYCNINIITDKIELDEDTIETIKEKGLFLGDNSSTLGISFINTDTGKKDYSASIYPKSIENYKITGPLTILRPDIEISTYNKEIAKLLPADTQAVYIKNNAEQVNGISYFVSRDTVNDRLGNSFFDYSKCLGFEISGKDGKLQRRWSGSGTGLSLSNDYIAYVLESNYATPTDTPTEATTKETETAKPEETTKETEATTAEKTTKETETTKPEETTKETETATAEETTKETETTKPEETTKETEATTPEVTTKETESTTPEVTTKETESTTPETTKEPEATKPGSGDDDNKGEITKPDTDTEGKNVAPEVVAKEEIIDVTEVNNKLIENLVDSKLAEISVTSSAAPKLNSNIFSQMKSKQKDITIGVTDDNDRLQYEWKFNGDTITQTDMNIDLSISFDTDRAEAVKEITGRDDVMYLSFAHHGTLPGPATIKTYVGNQYKDGDIVYLYYFNEEENRVESGGGVNKGLVVKNGYVEYTITHCSVYFLSTAMANDVNAVEPDNKTQGSDVVPVPDKVNDTTPTGDTRNATVYVMETIIALAVIGGLVYSRKRRA